MDTQTTLESKLRDTDHLKEELEKGILRDNVLLKYEEEKPDRRHSIYVYNFREDPDKPIKRGIGDLQGYCLGIIMYEGEVTTDRIVSLLSIGKDYFDEKNLRSNMTHLRRALKKSNLQPSEDPYSDDNFIKTLNPSFCASDGFYIGHLTDYLDKIRIDKSLPRDYLGNLSRLSRKGDYDSFTLDINDEGKYILKLKKEEEVKKELRIGSKLGRDIIYSLERGFQLTMEYLLDIIVAANSQHKYNYVGSYGCRC